MLKGLNGWRALTVVAAGVLAAQLSQLAWTPAATAHSYKKGELVVDHPWARPTPASAANGAVYLEVRNGGAQPDRLVGARTALTPTAELHNTVNEDGVMKMRHMADGIAVPAGGSIKLEPAGYHLMLIGLKEPLKEGARYPITLIFEKAGDVPAEIAVEKGSSHPAPSAGAEDHKNH